jgi:hypothetical protein
VPAGDVIAAIVRRAGIEERLRQERAVVVWPRVAGPELSRRSRALEVRDGVLWVGVESAAWAAQLSFLRSEILRRLHAEGATVSAVRFRLARMERQLARDPTEPAAPALPPLRPRERHLAETLAAPIADVRVADAWRSLVETGLRRARARAEEG